MITIIADDHIPFLKGVLEPYARMVYLPGNRITKTDLLRANGLIIRTRTKCDESMLEGTPVKFVATATIGFDHIDTEYCAANGIQWNHAPGCNSASVKQYMAAALAHQVLANHFQPEGKVMGIIGVGNVGSKIARLALTNNMRPMLNDPPRALAEGGAGFTSLDEILAEADVISLHVPLNKEGAFRTWHLADEAFFSKLQRKPLLINTSRGEIMDEKACREALKLGQISGYIADVWENEPDIDLALMRMARIATPHIAGYSVEGKANGTAACVRAASRFFGLELDNWSPQFLPPPPNPHLRIITTAKTDEQIVAEGILASYNIIKDDQDLRNDPGSFERLRNYYPVRREFEAFSVKLAGPRPSAERKLKDLGFNV